MTNQYTPVVHDTLVIDRHFKHPPAFVFQAWSSEDNKRPWFANNKDWENYKYELDFRVGGREYDHSRALESDMESIYDARYEDIVDGQRIVLAYTMTINGVRLSSSLLTLEFIADGDNTRLSLTEQIAMFGDREGIEHRREGWQGILGTLEKHLNP
jgi:uncharacterized protein YndB with AHSA1/START domain